jgi:hypothetical protein
METLHPRDQIPESWLEKSRCPYCASAPLVIEHPAGSPDQFSCPTCELTFQVAQKGPSVFVVRDPLGVASGHEGRWVEMKTLIESTHPARPVMSPPPTMAPAPDSASSLPIEEVPAQRMRDPIYDKYPAEVIENAADLYAMGNSKLKIKEILAKYSGLADEEIEEILLYSSRQKAAARPPFKLPRWALGCLVVPFLCLILYGLVVFVQYRAASSIGPEADPRVITIMEYEKLPRMVRDLIPEEVQQVQMPIAIVNKLDALGGEIQSCPEDGEQAAALFGGESLDWQYNTNQQAWMMQSVYGRNLLIPETYLVIIPLMNKGLSIQLVPGPAQIGNAYLLLVRCP